MSLAKALGLRMIGNFHTEDMPCKDDARTTSPRLRLVASKDKQESTPKLKFPFPSLQS